MLLSPTPTNRPVRLLRVRRLQRRLVLITMGLVILLAVALRLSGMSRSFWIDEILTYRIAKDGFESAATLTY